MELKITTLIEDMPDDKSALQYEHGLSLYIEFQGKKILFDTGQSGAFIKNAEKLGKTITGIDYLTVSHGHYDHSGGVLQTIPLLDERTRMLVGKGFFAPKYKRLPEGGYKYTGNCFTEQELTAMLYEKNVIFSQVDEDVRWLDDNIVIFRNFRSETSFEQPDPDFLLRCETHCSNGICHMGDYCLDEFKEELAMGLLTSEGLVLVTGCSHVGIVNILRHVGKHLDIPVRCVLGGTHLVAAGRERLEKTVEAFKQLDIEKIAVSHCTGEAGMEMLQENFRENYIRNNTGNVVCL